MSRDLAERVAAALQVAGEREAEWARTPRAERTGTWGDRILTALNEAGISVAESTPAVSEALARTALKKLRSRNQWLAYSEALDYLVAEGVFTPAAPDEEGPDAWRERVQRRFDHYRALASQDKP